ncbi:unnamed protein product, partial [marine sediment metagenome]
MGLLEKLCKAPGISGFEDEIQKIMKEEFEISCDKVEIDNFGNVIGEKGKGKKKIMLAAHMDEIVLETDAPYLSPFPNRRNEPINIKLTAQ